MRQERLFTQPLYLQLRDALAERIANGEWKAGDTLPNEADLARELGVSQGTVRKSLDLLEGEHLLTRRQGRGTFVNNPAAPAHVGRYTKHVASDGKHVLGDIDKGEVTKGPASAEERKVLHLPLEAEVHRLHRKRSYQRKPFLVEDVAVPVALFPDVSAEDWTSRWLTEIAPSCGVLLGKSVEHITPGVASAATALALRVPEGTPILILGRLISTRDGQPAAWRRAECISGGLRYQITTT
jgi:GntR family transcriptional regulator